MKRYVFITAVLILSLWAVAAVAQGIPLMRISVENTDSHVQAQAVKRFADEITEKLRGRIDIQFFANARLFRDQDVIQALNQGKIEMAVPGTWHVSRFEPNVEIFLLPLFYGRPAQANYSAVNGKIGQTIAARLESRLHLRILGRWIDLGHAHLFSVGKKILRYEDIKDLRVRVAGGAANKLRIQALGGRAMIIPWPDLPQYLQQGRVDTVLTSYETIRSASFWEKGIRYAFEDRQYFPQYIPLVRMSFWNKLPNDIRLILTDVWEKQVDSARMEAARAQRSAKNMLIQTGVDIVVPDPQQIEYGRQKPLAKQAEFVKILKIDPDLVAQLMKAF